MATITHHRSSENRPDPFTEEVRGTIVGGDDSTGRLFYEGRQQGSELYADDEAQLIAQANQEVRQIKTDFGAAFTLIYPKDAWELRIYN